MRKGVQVFTVRMIIDSLESYKDTLIKIRDIGYDSVQTFPFPFFSDKDHKTLLDEIGLKSESANGKYESMLNDLEAVKAAARQAHVFGTDLVSISTMPKELRESREGYLNYAESINKIGSELKKEGLKLLYHPHALEFYSLGNGLTGMDILYGETDPEVFWFSLDTHWLQAGGVNPCTWIHKTRGRLPVVHFKDYKIAGGAEPIEQVCRMFAEVGEGNLDWPSIIEASREAGVRSAVVEQDICPGDPLESLAISYRNMVKFGL